MKKFIGYLITGLVGFAAGGVAGYLVRKKATEVAFEEISEEEQAKQIAEDGEDPIKRPIDIQQAINRVFGVPDGYKGTDTDGDEIDPVTDQVEELQKGVVQLDTQKERYFKRWKAEEAMEETKSAAPVDDDDLENGIDHEFLEQIQEEAKDEDDLGKGRPPIEEASMEDWNHWIGEADGAYDCVEVYWFTEDGVVADENGDEIPNPEKELGFDVAKRFYEIDEDTTGDPDIRVVYNHRQHAIFQIIRKEMSFSRKRHMEEYGADEDGDEQEWIHSRQ